MSVRKPVEIDGIVFDSVTEAIEYTGHCRATINEWCDSVKREHLRYRWHGLKRRPGRTAQRSPAGTYTIRINRKHYDSYVDAARSQGMTEPTIRYRLSRPDLYPDYELIELGRLQRRIS